MTLGDVHNPSKVLYNYVMAIVLLTTPQVTYGAGASSYSLGDHDE